MTRLSFLRLHRAPTVLLSLLASAAAAQPGASEAVSGGSATTASFCSTVPSTIPGIGTTAGPANPYPNTLEVAGVTGAATDVNVRLIDLTHTAPDDLDILLQHPLGLTAVLMSDVGGITNIPAVTLTLDDEATSPLPNDGPLTSGTFLPTNINPNDTWPAPAPSTVAAGNTLLSTFDGVSPNGVWSLFILDDLSARNGALVGWCVDVTTGGGTAGEASADASAASLVAVPNPAVGHTEIRLTANAAQTVRVAVYDAVGRQVATLYDGAVAAGASSSFTLDTSGLPAGVYVVRAVGERVVQATRIAVVR